MQIFVDQFLFFLWRKFWQIPVYSVGEILRLSEGDLAPVSCVEQGAEPCSRSSECRVLPLWNNLNRMIVTYLDSVSLTDLMKAPEASGPA